MNKKFDFIKAIYFLAFGIIFTVVMVLLFVIPHLKEYREANRQTQRFDKQIEELEKKEESLKHNIERLRGEYGNGFDVLSKGFDKEALMKHLPKGCELVLSEAKEEEVEGKFKKVTYEAVMMVSDPKEYYEFVQRATKDGTLCGVDQSVVMQSIEGGRLKIGFIVHAYSYAKKEHEPKEKEGASHKESHDKHGAKESTEPKHETKADKPVEHHAKESGH